MAEPEWVEELPGISVWRATSADDFLDTLRRSKAHWWEASQMPWAFRGHADEAWPLLPSAWREGNGIIAAARAEAESRFDRVQPQQHLRWHMSPNFLTGATQFGNNDVELQRRLTIEATAELLPVFDFLLTCDALGLAITTSHLPADPTTSPDWLIGASDPLNGDDYFAFSDIPTQLALAQQHGLPTRLLDWTLDPVAAAFFAIEALGEQQRQTDIVVWALHRRRARQIFGQAATFPNGPGGGPIDIRPSIEIVRPPGRDNPYLAAQSGLFTSLRGSGVYFMQSGGQRPALERFVAESGNAEPVLRKLILPRRHVAALAITLEREWVSRSRLMPTHDNAAADVRRRWLTE